MKFPQKVALDPSLTKLDQLSLVYARPFWQSLPAYRLFASRFPPTEYGDWLTTRPATRLATAFKLVSPVSLQLQGQRLHKGSRSGLRAVNLRLLVTKLSMLQVCHGEGFRA